MRGSTQLFNRALWLLCLISSTALADSPLRAWTDRNTLNFGETVTLNVELSDARGSASPDFSVLESKFTLLGSSTNTQMQIINGRQTVRTVWAVGLEPLREGVITVPELRVGQHRSAPFQITVLPAPVTDADALGDVFIELEFGPERVHVQQQMLLQVRLLYAVTLTEGVLTTPEIPGAVVDQLGSDASYATQRGGRRYQVLERRYAVTPESSGSLELAPIRFEGRAMDRQRGGFFDRGRRVDAVTPARQLDVLPRPAASGSGPWLPARELVLELMDGAWPATATVGEPLTLGLRIRATGLAESQLPEPELPGFEGVRIYPEQSSGRRRNDGEWLIGERSRRFAIIPSQEGELLIPDIEVQWWNTSSERLETARLAGGRIAVLPAAGALPGVQPPGGPASDSIAAPQPRSSELMVWQGLFAASLLLWALSVWHLRRARPAVAHVESVLEPDNADTRAAARGFRLAIAQRDLSAVARALLRWANCRQPQLALRSLGALSERLADSGQQHLLQRLQAANYAQVDDPGLLQELDKAFAKGPRLSKAAPTATASRDGGLPPLYPAR